MIKRKARTSRLVRTSDRQNKKQALIFTVGIIVLIGILIQFGPTLVNVFGNVVYTLRGGDKQDIQPVGDQVISAPTLIGIPEATQSSHISFSGSAPDKDGVVELYVNDQLEDEIDLKDTSFAVDSLALSKGSNVIKARYVNGKKASAFTDNFEVNYIVDKPKLELSFPNDGATFTRADKSIQVTGSTDSDNTVTINSFRAIVDSDGKFSYQMQLNDGENQLTIEALNPAGVSTQKQIKVTYNP